MNNNVLWKRLYYWLFIIAIWLIGCFCNAWFETLQSGHMTKLYNTNSIASAEKYSLTWNDLWNIYCLSGTILSNNNTNCNGTQQSPNCTLQFIFWKDNTIYQYNDNITFYINKLKYDTDNTFFWCIEYNYGVNDVNQLIIKTISSTTQNTDIDYEIMKWTPDNNNWWWQQCDYTDYELKSDITENYCKNKFNNLIDENECNCENEWENECTWWIENWTGETNWSSIYINNIQHNWAWLINITIPEEIERDYTNQDDEINVDVLWYWYDQEKMQSMVNTQYYTPTPEDMNKLVWKIADFLPLMAIVLLVCYAWRLIKKIF